MLFLLILCVLLPLCAQLRVLHLTFHGGCIKDLSHVGQQLGVDITHWNPLSDKRNSYRFLGTDSEHPMAVYNLTHERAERVWKANKHYFESFDLIITSDTAQLSRVFLQNGWSKPLIIWVCNRFNYCVGPGSGRGFDAEFYSLFERAMHMSNVFVRAYTPFEHYFAALYRVDIRGPIIKPIGSEEGVCVDSLIPSYINKKDTVFVYPGFPGCVQEAKDYITRRVSDLGVAVFSGKYNGPDDLKDFKGVVYFPYQASNFALFENLQRGIVHFVPSERFIEECVGRQDPIYYWHEPYYCEWYFGVHRDIFVYFDSWDDLKVKIERTDYTAMRKKIKQFAVYHRDSMLAEWRTLFDKAAGITEPKKGKPNNKTD